MQAGSLSQFLLAESALHPKAAHLAPKGEQIVIDSHGAKVATTVKNLYTRSV